MILIFCRKSGAKRACICRKSGAKVIGFCRKSGGSILECLTSIGSLLMATVGYQ